MSKFKKIASLAVAFVMSVSLMAPAALAATLPKDVTGTKYEESVQLLQALKIMVGDKDTGEFRLEDGIIRSEVAKIAVTLSGLSDVAESSKDTSVFPDVVANHWANGYINVAAAQKFIVGDDVGTFRPDDKITFAEAVTIIDRVLGYEPSAKSNGGFPTGYLVVAGQIGLLKGGVNAGTDADATRGMVAMMSFNGLTIDQMERTGYGADEKYEVVEKTLLKDKLSVEKKYGQVVANGESSLTGSSSLHEDEVQIKVDAQVDTYKVKETNAKDFLARNVIFYVQESDTTNDLDLILVRADSNKNTELKVTSSNIEGITGTDSKTLSYWMNKETDKKPETATISNTAKVFYNGVATDYDLNELANLTSGHVTLIDADRSDVYSYVFVTEYKNLVVDEVSTTSFRVNDKYNLLSLTLDPSDKNIRYTITKDGVAMELKDLKEWDVLSVAMDQKTATDSKIFNVLVSNNKVTGKIVEIQENEYTIDGKVYELASNYTQTNQPALALNDEGTFYLDVEGKIAAVDTTTQAGSNYAYLVRAETASTIDNTLDFQLFGKDGETTVIPGADKIKVNSTTGLNGEQAKAAILAANNGAMPQLITYELNSNGEIYYVNTAEANGNGSPVKDKFSLDFKSTGADTEYSSTSGKLGNFNVNDDTLVLDIPTGKTDTEDYAVRNTGMFVDKSKYEVEIYDLSDDLTAKVVIVKNSTGKINAESPIAVVQKLTETQNSDSVIVNKLYALENGVAVEKMAKDTSTLVNEAGDKIKTGDVIQYQTNARGEIDKVTVLFDANDRSNEAVEGRIAYEGTDMVTIYGRVTKKFATSINVIANGMSETNLDITNAKVYNYDFSKSIATQVSLADASSIIKYDDADARKVFIRMYKGEVKEIVIIKEK